MPKLIDESLQIDTQTGLFDGADYCPDRDRMRLMGQLKRIWNVIKDGKWYSLKAIERLTGAPGASISAQLRNLRKIKFGSHNIIRRYKSKGLYEYRLSDEPKPDRADSAWY